MVNGRGGCLTVVAGGLLLATVAMAQQSESQRLEKAVEAAQADYDAGRVAKTIYELESLLPPSSAKTTSRSIEIERLGGQAFHIEELLGLSYASLSHDERAIPYLEAAVRLKPQAEEARTNLAASLMRLGRTDRALEEFRQATKLAPQGYTANHNLGEAYLQVNRLAEGIPYLELAQSVKPSAYENGYDLAMAELLTKQYAKARAVVEALTKVKDTGELHNLQGQIEEGDGKYLAAVNQFEIAAHMDPSEQNLFDWGSELMLHRTYEPAIEVFKAAAKRYPKSSRVLIGLGMTFYARGLYEDSVKALLTASDLNPLDARCYLFLSRAYSSSPSQVDEVIKRFQRYVELEPKNSLAQFYYAMSLWKGKRAEGSTVDLQKVEMLLQSSIALDGRNADAHMQLGNLYADEHQYERSVPEYVRAAELSPSLADAHYRLGTDYTHMGQKEKAQAEYAVYQKLRSEHMAEVDKERAEVQQFVYSSREAGSSKP